MSTPARVRVLSSFPVVRGLLQEILKVIRAIAAFLVSSATVTQSALASSPLAQAQPAPAPAPQQPGLLEGITSSPVPLIIILVLIWVVFMGGGARRKDEKKRKELLNQIKRGDRVQTIGGILGKVVETEDTKMLLKVDESSNTKIWFSRDAIYKVLGEEKAAETSEKK